MASLTAPTETITKTEEQEPSPSVTLKLRKPKSDKKVNWKEGTVDNEDMGKKKSKCCCIYEKPHTTFDESSSSSGSDDDDDDCKMCKHQKKGKQHKHDGQHEEEH